MSFRGNIIRPPSEANSIILQVTVGWLYNKCIFCGVLYLCCRWSKNKDTTLSEIERALAGHQKIVPENMRVL